MSELVEFKDAKRAIPDDRAGSLHDRGERFCGLRTDVKNHVVLRDILGALGGRNCGGRKFLATHHINRNRHRCVARGHHVDNFDCLSDQPRFRKGLADGQFLCQQECIGDAPSDHKLVDFFSKRFQNRQFG